MGIPIDIDPKIPTNFELQLVRCGYDPKSSRYGADTSRTEEITQGGLVLELGPPKLVVVCPSVCLSV